MGSFGFSSSLRIHPGSSPTHSFGAMSRRIRLVDMPLKAVVIWVTSLSPHYAGYKRSPRRFAGSFAAPRRHTLHKGRNPITGRVNNGARSAVQINGATSVYEPVP